MKTIAIFFMKLGLNKAVLKLSGTMAFLFTAVSSATELTPKKVLGVTIFLWCTYIATIFIDWASGIAAAKIEAKRNQEEFDWDVEKALSNFFKHAVFVMIMAAIYFFQKELLINNFSESITMLLTYIKFAYFGYSMINEWLSIEKNKHRISGKYSRLYKMLKRILDLFDKAAIQKVEQLTNTKEDDKTK